ncbi:GTPase-associated system all-helical protein GASH [Flavobacterium lindanitolerans]|uniref:GTPase-associated system all-helical protein GASH n=1 Tax=Flavobacterium lindanitolerans TaxID=428988 RepID=UPI0031E28CDD
MLQSYLNANLLSLTDDGDFKKLKKSADDIAKKLAKTKAKIVSYTLSAIDPDISVDNIDIMEVKEIIIKNWSTFATNAKDTPLTYIRAVMLEALNSLSTDINQSLLIWFASRNIVQYHNLIGKEKEIIVSFLAETGNEVTQKANKEWALSNNDPLSKISCELKEISAYGINKETLQKYLEDASGPHNEHGESNFDSPNPYWPNSANNWSYKFAPRAAKGIKTAIDPSLKAIATVVNENKNIIQNSLNKILEQVHKEVSNRNKSLQLRSELLWWKEAKYSSSTDRSYNELDGNILGIVLAHDYSCFIPEIYPKSVDYFFKETYNGLKGDAEQELVLEDFLKTVIKHAEELKSIVREGDALICKSTLMDFIKGLLWNKTNLLQFEELVGIPLDIKLSSSELMVWLFHDIQLSKILNMK